MRPSKAPEVQLASTHFDVHGRSDRDCSKVPEGGVLAIQIVVWRDVF